MSLGLIFAFLAAITWALGDFMIEKTSRKAGSLPTLFYVTLFGSVAIFPFVYKDLHLIFNSSHILILVFSSAVLFFSALFDFKALMVGKISIVEPICAFEVPITAFIAFLILGERLHLYQVLLMGLIVFGIFLVAIQKFSALKHIHAEKGVWFAVLATIGMGGSNFLFAESARLTNPLVINWFASMFMFLSLSLYFLKKKGFRDVFDHFKINKKLVATLVVSDNLSWIFYTYAALTLPIAIVVGVSESYIVIAALLGLFYNKEKLRIHQFLGMACCILGVILLSATLH